MSEAAKAARKAMHAKIARITRVDPHQKVDASSYTPPDALDADVKTGARPVSQRLYKRGGKTVGKVHGEHANHHAGRKPRKSGGRTLTADSMMNRDSREANEERPGGRAHKGAFKRGGHAEKFEGSARDEREDHKLAKKHHMSMREWEHSDLDKKHDRQRSTKGLKHGGRSKSVGGSLDVMDGEYEGTRPTGGREVGKRHERKHGGRAKGKTNIHINIGTPPGGAGGLGALLGGGLPPMPPRPPMGGPPMGGPPMGGMPPGGPPMGGMPPGGAPPMPMPRKRGGRTYAAAQELGEHTTGSGGGLGRLAKIRSYGHYD